MVQLAAQRLQQTGHDQYGWFPAGSGPGPGVKTQAKPEIWTDPSGFHDAQARFQKEADLMVQAVGTGDQAGIQAQAKAVGDACGACHQKYRQKD
jgi:cytochrome c556